jgi:hypothetical protein
MTILHSLSIIHLATAGLKIRKNNGMYGSNSHKLKWKQLIPGSLVNKYKLDLLCYALFPQNICHFANPLMQFVIGNMQGFRRVIGLKYYGCFITSLLRCLSMQFLAMFNFASVNQFLLQPYQFNNFIP